MDAAESKLFAQSVTRLLAGEAPDEAVPALLDAGFDDVRDDDDAVACGVLFEAAGTSLSGAPLTDLLLPPSVRERAPAARLVLPAALDSWPATIRGDELVVDGIAPLAETATSFALPLHGGGIGLVAAQGLARGSSHGLDSSMRLGRLQGQVLMADVTVVTGGKGDGETLRAALLRCLAHELVGVTQKLLDRATEHVLQREQFGRALGTYQTVQHRLAQAHVDLLAARHLLAAAWSVKDLRAALAAKACAGSTALRVAADAQQLTGAVGFTWEFGLHHGVRRAYVLDLLMGSAEELYERLGRDLIADSAWEPLDVGF